MKNYFTCLGRKLTSSSNLFKTFILIAAVSGSALSQTQVSTFSEGDDKGRGGWSTGGVDGDGGAKAVVGLDNYKEDLMSAFTLPQGPSLSLMRNCPQMTLDLMNKGTLVLNVESNTLFVKGFKNQFDQYIKNHCR